MQDGHEPMNRRNFLKQTSGIAAAAMAAPMILPDSAKGANDKINVAVLGVNGRGKSHISGYMDLDNAVVTTLVDPDANVLAARAKSFEEKYNQTVKTEQDMRKVFDDKSIDAVSIATPNHWHSLATIWACQAGKDVYVEKPGSHNIFEGRKMVEAAQKYDRIVQHGVQLRSSKALQEAVQHLRNGVIGDIYMGRVLVFRWRGDDGIAPFEPVPENLDYDLWLGPGPKMPFSRNIVHYKWHWHWEFGNGDLGNQGVHETDMALWGLGTGLPDKIMANGGKFLWNDHKTTPEVLTGSMLYTKENKLLELEVRPWCTNLEDGAGVGNIFYGSEGYMVIKGYNTYETYLGKNREPGPSGKEGGNHYENFVQAVVAHDKSILNAPVETAHLSSAIAHMANTAFRLGRVLNFDPITERYVDDQEANEMLSRNYRHPYIVPDRV